MTKAEIEAGNRIVLERLGVYLNEYSDFITEDMIEETTEGGILSTEEAYGILLAGALNLYDSREIREGWFESETQGDGEIRMIHKLETAAYQSNPYYQQVRIPEVTTEHGWQLTMKAYKPYEAFVCNDLVELDDGRVIAQIGFFEEEYRYPCVLQDGREWMLITPNEIETMKEPIAKAHGRVVTYGLGLGYFAYMAARKAEVTEVTVVELDLDVIKLFEAWILPGMEGAAKEKIRIIQADALEYAGSLKPGETDFVFADIWHDPSDGVDLYLRLKKKEKTGILYTYWIEKTLQYYL